MNPGKPRQRRHLYEFGAFRLDPSERIFARNGERIPLAPKAFDTLLILVQHSGRVLTKDELIRTLWPDSFVEENNLTQHISALRRVLGNSHLSKNAQGGAAADFSEQEFIETVPKLGYRFVCDVRETADAFADSPPADDVDVVISKRTRTRIVLREEREELETEQGADDVNSPEAVSTNSEPRQKSGRATRSMAFAVAASVVAVALLGGAIYRFRIPAHAPDPAFTGRRTLAVLPLRNLKPGADTDFLSMALADAIISRLGYVGDINVEPLSAVTRYRNSELDARQIGQELQVQNVLTGSYVKEGNDFRVTMEFISVDGQRDPWRDNLEFPYDKLFTVQDRVAISVFHLMGIELQPQEVERLNKGLPTNPAAYEYYLRGLDEGYKSNFERAVELLQKSVSLESGNAMAWDQLATVYVAYGANQGGDAKYISKGWQAFQRALELDPDDRFIIDNMAFQLIEHNRVEQAIPLLQESLKRNPNDSFAHWYLSEAYRYVGALEQSLAEGELALRLNPNVAENLTFNTYLYVGQYQKFLDSLPRDESNARYVFYRGLAYYYLQDKQKAEDEFDRAFMLNPALLHAQIGRALTYALRNESAAGIELMKSIEQSGGNDGEMLYKMAQAYAQLGEKASAIRLLRKSIESNFYPLAYFSHDPLLEPLHTETEYATVMEIARDRQEAFRKRLHGSSLARQDGAGPWFRPTQPKSVFLPGLG